MLSSTYTPITYYSSNPVCLTRLRLYFYHISHMCHRNQSLVTLNLNGNSRCRPRFLQQEFVLLLSTVSRSSLTKNIDDTWRSSFNLHIRKINSISSSDILL